MQFHYCLLQVLYMILYLPKVFRHISSVAPDSWKVLTLSCWINKDATPTSNLQPIRLLDLGFWQKFTYSMTNSADPDQLASEEANWSGSTLFTITGHVVFNKRSANIYFISPQKQVVVLIRSPFIWNYEICLSKQHRCRSDCCVISICTVCLSVTSF